MRKLIPLLILLLCGSIVSLNAQVVNLTALEKSIELDAEVLNFVPEDEDLKLLRALPAFQKLLREAEKQRGEADPK